MQRCRRIRSETFHTASSPNELRQKGKNEMIRKLRLCASSTGVYSIDSVQTMRRAAGYLFVMVLVACGGVSGCSRSPANPDAGPLATGRWAGESACLSVADTTCDLVVGCGHGRFTRPTIRADGTFDVDGTYRIEVGPISI